MLLKFKPHNKDYYKNIIFDENCIKIIKKDKSILIVAYSNIKKITFEMSVFEIYKSKAIIEPSYKDLLINLEIDAEGITQNDFSELVSIWFKSDLNKFYKLLDFKPYFNNFNLKIKEENSVKNSISIPIVIYNMFKIKLNPAYKFTANICSALYITFIGLLFYYLDIIHNQIDYFMYFLHSIFFFIGFLFSISGFINEIKLLKLKNKLRGFQNYVNTDNDLKHFQLSDNDWDKYTIQSLVKNNKIICTKDCIDYINKKHYINFVLFILNLAMLIYLINHINFSSLYSLFF